MKLNPRNFRSCGRATALFASFTLGLSFCVMNCVMPSITRCPARSLNVAEQWRNWTSLRSPFLARTDQPVLHHLGVQERPDGFSSRLSSTRLAICPISLS